MPAVAPVNFDVSSMAFEANRLATFKNWPFDDSKTCSKQKMAEAGFFHMPGDDIEPDASECFFCCKQLDGWEESDDPWTEHQKHAKNCEFATMRKSESDITLDKFLNLCVQALKTRIQRHYTQDSEKIEDFFKKFKQLKKA